MRPNRFIFATMLVTLSLLCVSCAKDCECTMYDTDGNATEEQVIKQMPKSLHLECSFFDTFADTTGGYICN